MSEETKDPIEPVTEEQQEVTTTETEAILNPEDKTEVAAETQVAKTDKEEKAGKKSKDKEKKKEKLKKAKAKKKKAKQKDKQKAKKKKAKAKAKKAAKKKKKK